VSVFDISKLPSSLGANHERVDLKTGLPTQATLDNEFYLSLAVKNAFQAVNDKVIEVEGDVTEALALGNQATASGRIRLQAAGATPTGVLVRFAVELDVHGDGTVWAAAGFYLDIKSDLTSRIVMVANQFTLVDPGYAGAAATQVFNYISGVFRFNVPVLFDTVEIAPGAVTGSATASGDAGSGISAAVTLYGNSPVTLFASVRPNGSFAASPVVANPVTVRTYFLTLDGNPLSSFTVRDQVVAANGSGSSVSGLFFFPGEVTRQLPYSGSLFTAGSHTFGLSGGGGAAIDADLTVFEFKR
jgi:hypothetical protein